MVKKVKTGFACGVFDLFHAGHVLMLKECKENCDYLIVALNTAESISSEINPGKKLPVFSIRERSTIVAACKYVDEVIQYSSEDELLSILKSRNINIRFLGEDYKGKPITGDGMDIEIFYTDRSHGLSTSLIRKRLRDYEK